MAKQTQRNERRRADRIDGGTVSLGRQAMPVHDWSRVDANVFHHFHQRWTIAICDTLNAGLLPPGYSALVEQHAGGLVPDVLALERRSRRTPEGPVGGLLTATPPKTSLVKQAKT